MGGEYTPREVDAEFIVIDERRTRERRARRDVRRALDPLFAALLIAQIAPQAPAPASAYRRASRLRAGIVVNVKA